MQPSLFSFTNLNDTSISRNLAKGYVVTAGGIQEMKLNIQTKYCSAKQEKQVKVSKG